MIAWAENIPVIYRFDVMKIIAYKIRMTISAIFFSLCCNLYPD